MTAAPDFQRQVRLSEAQVAESAAAYRPRESVESVRERFGIRKNTVLKHLQ